MCRGGQPDGLRVNFKQRRQAAHKKKYIYIYIYIQVARVPRLIQLEFGDECERKRAWREVGMEVGEGERQGGGEGVGKGDEDGGWEGVGKGDEDGGGHGGAG